MENESSASSSSNTTSCCNGSDNGASLLPKARPLAAAVAPPTPKSFTRGVDASSFPTTFIKADTSSFKQVVQMLTGSAATASNHAATAASSRNFIFPVAKAMGPKKPDFKLYERRSIMKNLKMSNPNSLAASATAISPRKMPETLINLPSLALSPVTPLVSDPFGWSPHPASADALRAEERAIAEKRFYLHPSPRTAVRDAQPPLLLPLFPVSSPRISSA